MSMTVLTILQTTVIFIVYMTMTCVLPFIILNPLLKGFRICEKLIMSIVLGNFYIINEVLILQLLHISNRFTLILFIVLPAYFVIAKTKGFSGREFIKDCWSRFIKLIKKELGLKSLVLQLLSNTLRFIAKLLKKCLMAVKRNPIDAVLFLALTMLLMYMYGGNLILHYGYCASDIPVHNYWINYLSRGKLFVAGVYPFGFHCIIYFMHAVFGIETYVMLRVFCFVQTLVIHWALLLFLKACLKTRYLGYLGTAVYAVLDIFPANTYSRYYATLPQEFGMIFILPSIYFGFAFFKFKKMEIQKDKINNESKDKPIEVKLDAFEKKTAGSRLLSACKKPFVRMKAWFSSFKKKGIKKEKPDKESKAVPIKAAPDASEKKPAVSRLLSACKKPFRKMKAWFSDLTPSKWCLIGFAMSFSLTLAVHFYGTMIAGIFCLAMAAGFFFRFLRKKYFWNIVITCTISVTIAVFPMAAAFATGTPLQGSLGWGMSVIRGDNKNESTSNIPPADPPEAAVSESEAAVTLPPQEEPPAETIAGEDIPVGDEAAPQVEQLQPVKEQGIVGRIIWAIKNYRISYLRLRSGTNTFISKNSNTVVTMSIYYCMAGLIAASLLFFLLRESDYAAQLASVSIFMLLMNVVLSAGWFNLPRIMDGNRCSIYFCYVLPILWCYAADAVLVLAFRWFKRPFIGNAVSLLLIGAVGLATVKYNLVRIPYNSSSLEVNGAITCLTNIIYGHDDWSWTICSANDELRMSEDYGFHHETIDLLRDIENIGRHADVTIPTKYTYFFIEKIPISYMLNYDGLGQSVSEEGAMEKLPYGGGLAPYQGRNRWIVMSKMYYWAQEFMRLHPGNMSVYYESDDFICYQLIQNIDSLFELGIDYGYNNFDYSR